MRLASASLTPDTLPAPHPTTSRTGRMLNKEASEMAMSTTIFRVCKKSIRKSTDPLSMRKGSFLSPPLVYIVNLSSWMTPHKYFLFSSAILRAKNIRRKGLRPFLGKLSNHFHRRHTPCCHLSKGIN